MYSLAGRSSSLQGQGTLPNFIIDVWKKDGMDEIEITCERAPESDPAEVEHIRNETKNA